MWWFATDFIVFVFLLGVLALCVIFAVWRLFRPGLSRFYWAACLALMLIGIGGIVTAEPADRVPAEFALGVWVSILGMIGTVVPALWVLLRAYRTHRR